MLRRLATLLVVASVSTVAYAQESRLDAVQKSGTLRVCTPGDHRPFSVARGDGYERIDVDLVDATATAPGVRVQFVKAPWAKLMDTFVEQRDIAVGGISVTLDRQKRAFFTEP
jgi:cyclohexadienyl dehydratase